MNLSFSTPFGVITVGHTIERVKPAGTLDLVQIFYGRKFNLPAMIALVKCSTLWCFMALKVSGYASSSGLKNKIVYESAVTATAGEDVLGTSGNIISLDIDNLSSAAVFFKMKTTSGAYTARSTYPDYQLRIPASTAKRFDFTDGLRFDQLTFWCTDGPLFSDTDNPGGTVIVTFIVK